MGQDADAIREDIEATRARMTERADAIAYKADVPARTKDRFRDVKDSLVAKVTGQKEDLMTTVSDHTPERGQVGDQAKEQAARAKGMAESNPLGLALGAVALGFLAGLAVPSTKIEQERFGPMADDLKAKAASLGQEAVDHGRAVATDVAQAAKEAVQESGSEHAAALKDAAQEELPGADSSGDSEDGGGGAAATSWSTTSTAGPSGPGTGSSGA